MISIDEGKKTGVINLTKETKTIYIDGGAKTLPVYEVRLDQIFYNDQNDRIATWINKFETEGNVLPDRNIHKEEYNNIIEKFIENSNPGALRKTKNNISMVGQLESGVILLDGRIIDGNRRFTCLRKLSQENPTKYQYFKTVILEKDIIEDRKQIKLLELMIQHGKEERVDYDPIDKLVGLYQDVIKNKIITPEEYRSTVNITDAKLKKKLKEAELMVEFLEFINAPEKFYIVRELKLDGPLNELVSILKNTPEEYEEDIKLAVFNFLIVEPDGDVTRVVREIKKIVKQPKYLKSFVEEQKEYAEEILDKIEDVDSDIDGIRTISRESDLKRKVRKSYEKARQGANDETLKDASITQTDRALDTLKSVNVDLFDKLSSEGRNQVIQNLNEIEKKINEIRGLLNNSSIGCVNKNV